MSVKTVVTGAAGRMGQVLTRLVREDPRLTLVGATERVGSPLIGTDLGGVKMSESLEAVLRAGPVDAVIDFTGAEASLIHARACALHKVGLVLGSTGFNPAALSELHDLAKSTAIMMAPNMSVGVNTMINAAAALARVLGDSYDIEVVEMHHRMKKDAPSGTALRLAEEVAKAVGRDPKALTLARQGMVGERPKGEIAVQTLRGGDIVGEHTIYFIADGERIELTHRATNRETFARGALRAAAWIAGKAPGLYGMADVLGLPA